MAHHRVRIVAVYAVLVGGAARVASAQSTPADPCASKTSLYQLVECRAMQKGGGSTAPTLAEPKEMGLADVRLVVLAMALKQATSNLYEDSRVDEQKGSASGTAGTTSAVSSAAVPAFLSLALENGAVTKHRSGNTMTFRANVAGILKVVDKHGLLATATGKPDRFYERLSNFTLSASFDTSRGIPEGKDPRLSGDVQQLSAWTARGELYNDHADHLSAFWTTASGQSAVNRITPAVQMRFRTLPAPFNDQLTRWVAETNALLSARYASLRTHDVADYCQRNPLCDVLNDQLRDIPLPDKPTGALPEPSPDEPNAQAAPDVGDPFYAVQRLADDFTGWMATHPSELAKAVSGTIVAVELLSDRGPAGVSLTTGRLVFAVNTPKATMTMNAGVSYPQKSITDRVTLGDPQSTELAGQLDIPFGTATGIGRFTFTVTFKFVHMLKDPIDLETGMLLVNTRGDIKLGQFRLTIPTNGTGMKIPLSLTVANRSDLVNEKIVRANVGVSYDLDSLLARFR